MISLARRLSKSPFPTAAESPSGQQEPRTWCMVYRVSVTRTAQSMAHALVEVSSVVVANAHNPSILNPDWLQANDVLPGDSEGWKVAEPPFTTPLLSRIRYLNGLLVVLDAARLSLAFNLAEQEVDGPDQTIVSLAQAYVTTLKHIPYAAVGSNFKAFVPCENAHNVLVGKFGSGGAWRADLATLSVKLNHRLDEQCVRLVDVAGTEFEEREGVSLSANYHRKTVDCPSTLDALGKLREDLQNFDRFVTMFEEEFSG